MWSGRTNSFACCSFCRKFNAVSTGSLFRATRLLRQHKQPAASLHKTTPSTSLTTSSPPPMLSMLVAEMQSLFAQANTAKLPLSAMYSSLSPEVRRDVVKPLKTLANAIKAAILDSHSKETPLPFRLSEDGLYLESSSAVPSAAQLQKAQWQELTKTLLPYLPRRRTLSPSTSIPNATTSNGRHPTIGFLFHALYFPHPCAPLLTSEGNHAASTDRRRLSSGSRLIPLSLQVPNDFYFGAPLNRPPPPIPAPVEAAYATRRGEVPDGDGSESLDPHTLSINDFVPYIPTFFVPVAAVVARLPEGYTEGHIDQYLAVAKTVQMVTVAGERYIRIHGGYGQLDLEQSAVAEKEWYDDYRPRPEIAAPFVRSFEGVRGKWMGLRMLLDRVGPEACSKLPYRDGPNAILYFAQLQQLFDFSPDNGGAVLLRPDKYNGLTPETSPCPRAFSIVLNKCPSEGFILLDELEALLKKGDTQRAFRLHEEPPPMGGEEERSSPGDDPNNSSSALNATCDARGDTWHEIQSHFPSLEYFLRSHGSTFWVGEYAEKQKLEQHDRDGDEDEDDNENREAGGSNVKERRPQQPQQQSLATTTSGLFVCRKRFIARLERNMLPLREQLQLAISERRKKDARRIRKKIALQHQADSPFFEPVNLAKEIHKALPRRGHVMLKFFLRNQLPEDLMNFMPKNYQKFFRSFPDLFQCFELYRAGNWCLSRVGNQLPQGVLRQEFSDEDCLRILAQYLARKGPRSVSTIFLHLPEGVREAIKKRHESIYSFALKHPTYFSIVLPIQHGNVKSAAVISLLQTPNVLEGTEGGAEDNMDAFNEDE